GNRAVPKGAAWHDQSRAGLRGAGPLLRREGTVCHRIGPVTAGPRDPRHRRPGARRRPVPARVCVGANGSPRGRITLLSTGLRGGPRVPGHQPARDSHGAPNEVTVRVRTPARGAVALRDIQLPVSSALSRVSDEMWRIVAVDSDLFRGVNQHLMSMKGKMLRP